MAQEFHLNKPNQNFLMVHDARFKIILMLKVMQNKAFLTKTAARTMLPYFDAQTKRILSGSGRQNSAHAKNTL